MRSLLNRLIGGGNESHLARIRPIVAAINELEGHYQGLSDEQIRAGIVLLARISEETRVAPRLGITMSRQVGGSVVRNRLKRQVREWFRRERCGFAPGLELVVIGRREAGSLDPAELRRTLRCAAERAGVVVR